VANRFSSAVKALFGRVEPLESGASVTPQPQNDVATAERATISLGPRFNPDELVGRKGLAIYRKMRHDEQVKAVMNFKRDAITARGWSFKYEDSSALSEKERAKRCQVFSEIICRMRGSFSDALNVIATGRDFGLSLTEKVYSNVTIDGKIYVGISELRGRDPSTFEFFTDDFGTLTRVDQVVPFRRLRVDMSRMIHYVHSPEFDPYYGRSDLREAYRAWFAKDRLVPLWLEYLEKMAGGFVVAKRTDESSIVYGSPEYTSLQEVFRNLHATAGIIPPKGVEIEVHWPVTTDAYEKACVFFDLAIAKALLVPNLLGISHTGQTGAFSQSQTQLEAFFWTLNADASRLEACLNEQLFRDLGDQNFGDGEYPQFCFKPASVEHIKWMVETWTKLISGKAVIPTEEDEAHIRKLLDMPKRDEKSTPLIDPVVEGQEERADEAQGFDQQMRENQDKRAAEEAKRAAEAANEERYAATRKELSDIKTLIAELGKDEGGAAGPDRKCGRPGESGRVVPHGKLKTATVAQFTRAVQRVAFSVIEDRQNKMAGELTSQVAGFTAKAAKRLLGTDEELTKLIDEDPTDIAEVEFSGLQKGKLKDLYRKSLASAWTLGGSLARNELERARGQRFVAMTDLRDKAADYFEANGFRMAGNVSDGVRALIQQELQNSVKFGRTAKSTREVIWDRLVSRGFTNRESVLEVEDDAEVIRALKDLWGASERQTAAYLDTLSRTNLFEAMNEARYAEFTDPDMGDFVVALEYSAILDDRTTDICEALNGKTFAADSPEWDSLRPPNHYNCRSVLIPITAIDGWDGRESPSPSVRPQAGFGGTLQ
jgi:SPP1 gp7 family putative phage head morphogenesis protein